MRKIKYVTIHHSAVEQQDINKVLVSFNRNHRARLHKNKNSLGHYIAYHYIIGMKGEVINTRNDADIGFINGNNASNRESIGICLVGHFDNKEPTAIQLIELHKLLEKLSKKYKGIKINGHCDIDKHKTCPGKMFPLNEFKLLYNYSDVMSFFKEVWEKEVPENERNFTVYDDKRAISVEDTKYLLDIVIMRDNKKDRSYVANIIYSIRNIFKNK